MVVAYSQCIFQFQFTYRFLTKSAVFLIAAISSSLKLLTVPLNIFKTKRTTAVCVDFCIKKLNQK